MSIIAVKGIPYIWNLTYTVKSLKKAAGNQFEALNFEQGKKGTKTCYIRLSERLDPLQVIEKINSMTFKQAGRLYAFIPEYVPDLPLATKPKKPASKKNRLKNLPVTPESIMVKTHNQILTELQAKYTGLYDLSRKTNHQLLENVAETIFERLHDIMKINAEASANCFTLSKFYRKSHPHFADFQLILSTLHRVQDAMGVQRDQINENELAAVPTQTSMIDNVPLSKVKTVCQKYCDKTINKILGHIENLKTDIEVGVDNEEEIARKKVRSELKKLSPYVHLIVKQVLTNHFVPQKTPYQRLRIYGEPFLPSRELMQQFLKRYQVVKVHRSELISNMLLFYAPYAQLSGLLAMDGTIIGGAKLVIRSSDMKTFKPSATLLTKMCALFGAPHDPHDPSLLADDEQQEWTPDMMEH